MSHDPLTRPKNNFKPKKPKSDASSSSFVSFEYSSMLATMEEAKAAAYFDELTRKGEGAARFKQGLGFSSSAATSNSGEAPARGSALASSSSSFLTTFVKASSPSKASELERQSQLSSIQNKLRTKKKSPSREARVSRRRSRSRSRERERERDRRSRRRSRSRSRIRERRRDGDRDRRRRRSRSRSDSDGDRRRRERRRRSRSRSSSPRDRRAERRNRSRSSSPARERRPEKRNVGVDYARLIQGYDKMSPAERVKAKMKLQLAETVEKDTTKGASGWERFEFNKDAPLDDEEMEAAEDDTALVKHIGQSFRFSAVEAKREQRIRDAHDEAIFGVPEISELITAENEVASEAETEMEAKTDTDNDSGANLLSEKVLAKQQGSWRDRALRQTNSQG